ncbi:MAG: hypothetical protein AAF531_06790 [Actinomycetota bacterium]
MTTTPAPLKHVRRLCCVLITGLAVALVTTSCSRDTGPTDVEITARDYSYEGVPETMAAGSSIILRNESAVEAHEIVAVRLADDEERSAAEIAQLPPDELQAVLVPPTAVILAGPDEEGQAVVGSATLDQPGRYVFFCLIPTEADPDAYLEAAATSDGPPDVPGGPPHFVQGMWAEVEVTE